MKKWLLPAFLLPVGLAVAHGIWIAPQHGELSIVYGMGYADDAYAPEKVKSVQAYDGQWQPTTIKLQPKENYTVLNPADNAAVLTSFFDNGFWEKGEKVKWQAVEQSAIKNPEDTSTSLKYNITVLKPYQSKMQPFSDLPVQIIPDTDPSQLKQGDKLGITVYVDGKVAAGIPVTADYINDMGNQVKTDTDGHAEIIIRNAGNNVIAALVNHPTPENKYAHLQRVVSSLSFKAGKSH